MGVDGAAPAGTGIDEFGLVEKAAPAGVFTKDAKRLVSSGNDVSPFFRACKHRQRLPYPVGFPQPHGSFHRGGKVMSSTAYIGLGSNLGDRQGYLDQAIEGLQEHEHITVQQVSSYFETDPVGCPPGAPAFLNAVVEVGTDLEPKELMAALLEIEEGLGRERREKNGPRTIDLDLLLYDNIILDDPDLKPASRSRTNSRRSLSRCGVFQPPSEAARRTRSTASSAGSPFAIQ
jgi:2-amino-4-hydroxy-6-hydroxymethyldihydropteridine diphosphokinase